MVIVIPPATPPVVVAAAAGTKLGKAAPALELEPNPINIAAPPVLPLLS